MNGHFAAAGILLSAVLAGTAGASFAQGTATAPKGAGAEANMAMVNGETWANSTPDERASFLLGMASIVNAEYQAGKGDPSMAGPSTQIVKAMQGVTLGDLQQRIDTWYATHPNEKSLPVASVVWRNWIQPNAVSSGSSTPPAAQPIAGKSAARMGMDYSSFMLYTPPPGSGSPGG